MYAPSLKIQVSGREIPTELEGPGSARLPVTDAEVRLVPAAALGADASWPYAGAATGADSPPPFRWSHASDGWYVPPRALEAGAYLLVVTRAEEAPVVQRLELGHRDGVLRVEAGWRQRLGLPNLGGSWGHGMAHCAATVSLVNAGQRAPAAGGAPQHSIVNVQLLPRSEWVGMAGRPHHGDPLWIRYVEGRRNYCWHRRMLTAGTIATLMDVTTREIVTAVKSAVLPDATSWVIVGRRVKHALGEDAGRPRPERTASHELGILDFYAHLDTVGREHPRTLLEAGLFGHSWVQGPPLWDTYDCTDSVVERHPGEPPFKPCADLDARTKDWLVPGRTVLTPKGPVTPGDAAGVPTMDAFPSLRDAFRPSVGTFRVFGCLNIADVYDACKAAMDSAAIAAGPKAFFTVPRRNWPARRPYAQGGWERATFEHLQRNIAQYVVGDRYGTTRRYGDGRCYLSYVGAAAQFLNAAPSAGAASAAIGVYAAPPGVGADFGTGPDEAGAAAYGLLQALKEENYPAAFKFYRKAYGACFETDELGYMNYTKMLSAPLPDPGWSTERSTAFYDEDQGPLFPPDDVRKAWDPGKPEGRPVLRLPSGLEVHYDHQFPQTAGPFQKPRAYALAHPAGRPLVAGHLYEIPGVRAERLEVRGGPEKDAAVGWREQRVLVVVPSDTHDGAVFVGEDGRSIWLTRRRGTRDFAPFSETILVFTSDFLQRAIWKRREEPDSTITNATLDDGLTPPSWCW